ncbi:phosphatase PAP2 family protein [Streptomyces sp. NPDC046900]|uniref:phosphatase PAP2 family protein n=1 Tax=Streptomyces sp. NPDC046900 TaxID=3155473 RepID=UPI003402C8DC
MQPLPVDSPIRRPAPRGAEVAATALGCASLLLLVLVTIPWHPLVALDADIARTVHGWALDNPGLTRTARFLTDWVWDPATMRVLCAVAVFWLLWRQRDRRLALWVAATCALGAVAQNVAKAAIGRARPEWPDPLDVVHNGAFPSGHAMTAALVCGLLLWVLRRYGARGVLWCTALTVAVVSVIGVGLTRVWLGVHWPSDVLGGWLFGALLVVLAVASYERWGGTEKNTTRRAGRS